MVSVMSLRCSNCGAPLTKPLTDPVNCGYCGALVQPDVPRQPPRTAAPQQAPGSSRAVLYIALGLGVLAAGGLGSFVFSGGALASLGEWYSPGGALVDANGDTALDLVGWAGTPTDQRNLSIIDGLTGRRLWVRADRYESEAQVLGISAKFFAVSRPNFALEIFNADRRERPVTVGLSDAIRTYARGDGCVQLETGDEVSLGITVPAGQKTTCAALEEPRHIGHRPGVSEATATARLGDVTFRAATRERGTPLLAVSAQRWTQTLWSMPLRYAAMSSRDVMLVATPAMVMTYGVQPGRADVAVLIGLDPKTGAVKYERDQGSTWSDHYVSFQYNNRFLIVTWGFGLHAYEPATGARVWHLGGR